ncbi:MAG: hypothetical protein DWQ01_14735 [Planctomycetota bacterium]|nr:MAG: hypothetical protein DWQ01_14735 [Planctomycetota bacterium]
MSRGPAGLRRRLRRRLKHRKGWVPWLLSLPSRALIRALSPLPEPFFLKFAARLAGLAWWSKKRRRIGRQHLNQAFPEWTPEQRDRVLRQSLKHLGYSAAEAAILSRRVPHNATGERLEFEPGSREALEAWVDKPLVIVQAHFGSVEAVPGAVALLKHRVAVPMRLPSNHYLAEEILGIRKSFGVEMLPRQGAMRHMLSVLENRGSLVLAADQNAHHAPVFIPWFNKIAATERFPVVVALKSGAGIGIAWGKRLPLQNGRAKFRVGFRLLDAGDRSGILAAEDPLEALQAVHQALQEVICTTPEQYLWIHDRYRTRPPEERRQSDDS